MQVVNFGNATIDEKDINVNAALYDIKLFFQGRNDRKGRMNTKSTDEKYIQI